MLIKKAEFDQLCPSYQRAIFELEAELASISFEFANYKSKVPRVNAYLKFSQNYLMLQPYWYELYR